METTRPSPAPTGLLQARVRVHSQGCAGEDRAQELSVMNVWEKAAILPCRLKQKQTDSLAVFAALMRLILMIQLNDL